MTHAMHVYYNKACVHKKNKKHTHSTRQPMLSWDDEHPTLLFDTPTLASSLQSLEHNLWDEVMHNGVKWKLFMSLTHKVKLFSLTKLGFEPEN